MKEIFRLKEMLEKENIPFVFIEREEVKGYQIFKTRMGEIIFSVVQHKYSYGNDVNLLEMWDMSKDDVEGYLSAEDVFERIKEHYKAGGIDEKSL
jgi:hypothetical protein